MPTYTDEGLDERWHDLGRDLWSVAGGTNEFHQLLKVVYVGVQLVGVCP